MIKISIKASCLGANLNVFTLINFKHVYNYNLFQPTLPLCMSVPDTKATVQFLFTSTRQELTHLSKCFPALCVS